jgi:3',5'-cyclic AMP phosphodiesterase CpdA
VIPLGQHPHPLHTVAHVSDTHLLAGGRGLHGAATEEHLEAALRQLARLDPVPEAIVFTGDLADLGEIDAYERLRSIVDPAIERMGAIPVWVMGNHDERDAFARVLLGADGVSGAQHRAYEVGDLRIIALDSSVPGYHHGAIDADQLEWLAAELSTPAPHGTLLALHHPPIPSPLTPAMELLELHDQHLLEEVVRGTDVRAVLAGHLHYSTHSLFAGVPVSVAAATCYTMNLSRADRLLSGSDAHQAVDVVHVYADRVVHTVVPLGDPPELFSMTTAEAARIEAMTVGERIDAFSRKDSPSATPEG